ncbi:MAG: acyl--CoA ligase [Planctomycetes bacterium]|nr:acyl--CoA ligase [Planctomycetota bacterium]MBI3843468.1 acyl--CoA ligase [Planctomycetota bacterium]
MSQIIPDFLEESAERFPEKIALAFPDERISFATLAEKSGKVAARLRRLGIGTGDRVAILHENAPAAVVYFWGILKRGAVSVDVPTVASQAAIQSLLAECRPRAIVISQRLLQQIVDSGAGAALPRVVFTDKAPLDSPASTFSSMSIHALDEIDATESEDPASPQATESDVAMIVYTSGTTGTPKGVQLSHENLSSNLHAANERMPLGSDDSILVVVPLHFIHGRMQLLMHTWIGGTMAFSTDFRFPRQVVRDIVEHHVSGFSGVPYHFVALMERGGLRDTPLPDLRYVLVTGGGVAPAVLRDLEASLPGVAIHVAYGLTEASPRVTHLGPSEVALRRGSVGRPIPGVHVEILSENNTLLRAREIGEVTVTGRNVMRGYVANESDTSPRIDEVGRLHTGDMGWLDEDGYLYLVGRKSELIKSAGERVFPREIENVIATHRAVSESAVVGVPDRLLGERILAFVVRARNQSVSDDEILAHCLKVLPFVRAPREVRFVDQLPKTASGKVDRRQLAKHAGGGPDVQAMAQP